MNQNELKKLLEDLDFHPSRKLGQNFMVDTNAVEYIAKNAAPAAGQRIVEVGPGFGTLTQRLLDSGADVISIELDHRLCAYLREHISAPNFTLVEADACKVDFAQLCGGQPFRVIANLPYSISSPFVAGLLELPVPPESMSLVLQRETAERFAAAPGCKAYGSLSARIQCVYKVKYCRTLPGGIFLPRPDVESALVNFTQRPEIPSMEERQALSWLLRTTFSSRRKKCLNNLAAAGGAVDYTPIFQALGLDLDIRAERLSADDYLRIVRAAAGQG